MRHLIHRWRLVVVIGIALLLLWGCKRTPSPVQVATRVPDTPAPDAWVEHEGDRIWISLPATWEAPVVTPEELQKRFAAFRVVNPELARGVAGDEKALQQIQFWAFGEEDAGFTDSLVILDAATPGGEIDVAQVVADVANQHQAKGYTIRDQDASLEIDGRPASWLTYTYDMVDSNQALVRVEAHQYFVAGQDRLWILTYTLPAERALELAPIVDRSARSFRLK